MFGTSGQGLLPLGPQFFALLIVLPMIVANRFKQNYERTATYAVADDLSTGKALSVFLLTNATTLVVGYAVYPSLFDSLQFMTPAPALMWLGGCAATLGALLTLWCRFALGQNYVGGYTLHDDHQLVQHGPYRFVRHPMYIGFLLTSVGVVVATGNAIILITDFVLRLSYLGYRVWREEMNLQAKFGLEYAEYQERTGKFFPRLRRSATR